MRASFSTGTVACLTRSTSRQIDYWARTGLLRPSVSAASGRGTRRRYSFQDLVAAQTVASLRQANCPLQKIRAAVRYLRRNYPDCANAQVLARLTLLTDGNAVYLLTDQRQVMEVVTRQLVWSVPLGKLIRQTQEMVDLLPARWIQPVQVCGRTYHLDVLRDKDAGEFTVQCRELPGAIEQGATAPDAVANGVAAIKSVLEYLKARRLGAGARNVQVG